MHKLEITLKQHTPMIHFQHDQEGATLRASEVKPKLDRFILMKLVEKEKLNKPNSTSIGYYTVGKNIAKEKGWLIGSGEHGALDYKIRISCFGSRSEYLIASNFSGSINNKDLLNVKILNSTPYFAQESVNAQTSLNDDKGAVLYRKSKEKSYEFRQEKWDAINSKGLIWNDIKIQIICLKDELNSTIKDIIEPFFITSNFGTRQNKGFGCFTVKSIKNDNIEIPIKADYLEQLKQNYKYVYSRSTINWAQAFSDIKSDYQKLKSGVNYREYIKSLLYCYSVNNGIGLWEKKKIKNEMTRNGISIISNRKYIDNSCKKCSTQSQPIEMFIRVLLGLAEHYEFNNSQINVGVDGGENFQRFKSPITFKVIEKTIYLLGNPITEDIFSKIFQFQIYNNNGKKIKCGAPFPLETPASFSLKTFLEDALIKSDKLNYTKHQSL